MAERAPLAESLLAKMTGFARIIRLGAMARNPWCAAERTRKA
jgi:hypothetical protein